MWFVFNLICYVRGSCFFYLCFCIYLRVLMSNKIFISTMFVSRNSNTTDSTGETEIAHTYWAQEWSLYCSIISFLMTVLWSGGHWFYFRIFLSSFDHHSIACPSIYASAYSSGIITFLWLLEHVSSPIFRNIMLTLFLCCFCLCYITRWQ